MELTGFMGAGPRGAGPGGGAWTRVSGLKMKDTDTHLRKPQRQTVLVHTETQEHARIRVSKLRSGDPERPVKLFEMGDIAIIESNALDSCIASVSFFVF